jgi:hypothetical protein
LSAATLRGLWFLLAHHPDKLFPLIAMCCEGVATDEQIFNLVRIKALQKPLHIVQRGCAAVFINGRALRLEGELLELGNLGHVGWRLRAWQNGTRR